MSPTRDDTSRSCRRNDDDDDEPSFSTAPVDTHSWRPTVHLIGAQTGQTGTNTSTRWCMCLEYMNLRNAGVNNFTNSQIMFYRHLHNAATSQLRTAQSGFHIQEINPVSMVTWLIRSLASRPALIVTSTTV